MQRTIVDIPEDADDLRNWLWDNVPGLEDSYQGGGLISTAMILRDWVGSHATFSHESLLLDHNELKSHELLKGALSLEGGLWCGGVSELYLQLSRAIPGMVAAKYNYGIREEGAEVTHMTVLVGTKDGRSYNLDPYIGYEWYVPGTGEMMPFGVVLGNVKCKRYSAIEMRRTPLPRPAITMPGVDSRYNWLFPEGTPEPVEYADRWVYYGATPSWEELFSEGTKNRLRADAHRGEQPLDKWLLDLMLVNPELSRFSGEYGWNEYACIRRLFYDLVEA